MRAGGLQDVTTFYRNDRTPTAGSNPHGFLLDPTHRRAQPRPGPDPRLPRLRRRHGLRPRRAGARLRGPDRRPGEPRDAQLRQDPATGEPPPEPASGATGSCTGTVTGSARACASRAGFASAKARPRGRKVRFAFSRRVPGRATVEVFQASVGRRVVGNRRIARFTGRRRSFTWSGKRREERPAVRPLQRARGRGRPRRPARHAAPQRRPLPARALVLPPPRLRPADAVQAELAGLRRRARRKPLRIAFRLSRTGATWRRGAPRRPRRRSASGPRGGARTRTYRLRLRPRLARRAAPTGCGSSRVAAGPHGALDADSRAASDAQHKP